MDMTDELLDRIERLARAATPGPWHWVDNLTDEPCTPDNLCPSHDEVFGNQISLRTVEEYATTSVGPLPKFVIAYVEEFNEFQDAAGTWHRPDPEYIAAASPDVVIALVEEIRALRERLCTQPLIT